MAEFFFESSKDFGVFNFPIVLGGDIERVHGDAFFGADAGMGGIETGLIDGVEEVVKETDPVKGLDFDCGARWVEGVGDAGADGDGDACFGAGFEKIDFPSEIVFWLVVFRFENGG